MTPVQRAKQLVDSVSNSPDEWESTYAAAENLLEQALQENPMDQDVLICLGAVLSDRGQHRRAVSLLEKVIALGSADRNAYMNLAIALMNCDSESRVRARPLFRLAEKLEPSSQTWEAYFDPHGH
jgi:Flp pilus assembly protein TadD